MNKKILITILLCLLLTGCYDYKEINSIAILSATSVDYIEDEFIITAQTINPQAPDKTVIVQSPFIIYTANGKTLQEAYRNITNTSSKFLYSNHLELLLFSENIVKEKLNEVLDFFSRNPAIRTEFNVLIYKNENPLNIITPINNISSSSIIQSLNTNTKYLGTSLNITFNDLLNTYLNPNIEITLPLINIKNENKKGNTLENTESSIMTEDYLLENLAVFKENKLVGYLNKDESITYNYIKNNIKNTILTYKCENNKHITLEIIKSNSKIKNKNNKININIELVGNVNENNCNYDLSDINSSEKIQEKITDYFNQYIKENIENVIKNYNSDIYGFLDIIYKYDYDYYKKIKNNSSYLKNLNIKVNTKINIKSNGNVMEVINEKNK